MSSCSTAGPQFGDMKSSNFLMLPCVTTEKRRLRSSVKRVHSYAHVFLVEGASVALPLPAAGCWRGRLKDVRAARRSETLRWSDKESYRPQPSVHPSASASQLSLNHGDVAFIFCIRSSQILFNHQADVSRRSAKNLFLSPLGLQREQKISTSSFLKLGPEDGKLAESGGIYANYTPVTFCLVHLNRHLPTEIRSELTWSCTNSEFVWKTCWLKSFHLLSDFLCNFPNLLSLDIFIW